jgi:hypothetical protein
MTLRAVIAGATGLIGSNLAEHLVARAWEVYGVARKPQGGIPGVRPVAADLLDPEALRSALAGIDPTHLAGRNQAFNIVNGDIFRWRWLWPKLAADFGIEAAPYPGRPTPLEQQLADVGPIWADVAAKHALSEPDLGKLASAWHTDLDLGREIEVVTDMTGSRLAGFHEYQPTLRSFLGLFARLRRERIIPA